MNTITPYFLHATRRAGAQALVLSGRVSGGSPRGSRCSERDRGDVPGWVMITLMSAVLVMGLLAIAAPALEGLFQQAISKVSK
ncbi:hypothetical protein [Sinomonas terrae]|uniref:Uncharacterized protein n=1 Tax=Sinomonas terrae TaxID=2908838 RepID=A0ABS9U049_9MICC|nr:hypothetical protein [Sinomonas terrae]MCH6469690.1 hypothetical protein [Sinomonas terrae]